MADELRGGRRRRRSFEAAGSREVARGLLLLALFAGPLLLGAVSTWAWTLTGLVTLTAFGLAVEARGTAVLDLPRAAVLALLLLAAVGLAQLVPLPPGLAARLLPDRVAALAATAPPPGLGAPLEALVGEALPHSRAWVVASRAPAETRDEVLRLGLLVLTVLATAALFRHARERRQLALAVAAAGAAAAILGLLQARAGTRLLWFGVAVAESAHPFGPYVNRNHFAGVVEVALPLALALALGAWSERRRSPERSLAVLAFAIATALVLIAALVLAGSRGGVIGAAVGVLVLGLLVARATGLARAAQAAAGAALLGVLALAAVDRTALVTRLISIDDTDGSASTRLQVWRSTLALAASHPIAGVGLGAFEDVFPAFEKPPRPWLFEHPESDWLWFLAEGGVGTAAAFALLAVALAGALRRHVASPDPADLVWAGAAASLAALAVHGIVDVNLHIPANAALAAALLGLLLAPGEERERVPGGIHPLPRAMLVVALLLAAAQLLRMAGADLLRASAGSARSRPGSATYEAELLLRASRLDSGRATLRAAAARALASAGRPLESAGEWAAALRGRPSNSPWLYSWGWQLALSDPGAAERRPLRAAWAERLLLRSAELDPSFPGFRARYGLFLVIARQDRLAEGLAEIRAALAGDPGSQDDVLEVLARRLPRDVLPRAVPDLPENRWRWAQQLERAGNEPRALEQYVRTLALARSDPAAEAHYRRLVAERHLSRGRHALAVPLLQALVATGDSSARVQGELGVGLAALGRFAEARRALERARVGARGVDIEQALAWVAWNLDDCPTASAAAGRALAADPRNVQGRLVIALCLRRRGELRRAHETLLEVLDLAPDDVVARETLPALEREMAAALVALP